MCGPLILPSPRIYRLGGNGECGRVDHPKPCQPHEPKRLCSQGLQRGQISQRICPGRVVRRHQELGRYAHQHHQRDRERQLEPVRSPHFSFCAHIFTLWRIISAHKHSKSPASLPPTGHSLKESSTGCTSTPPASSPTSSSNPKRPARTRSSSTPSVSSLAQWTLCGSRRSRRVRRSSSTFTRRLSSAWRLCLRR